MRGSRELHVVACFVIAMLLPRCAARAQDEQSSLAQQQLERSCERAKREKTTATDRGQKITDIVALQDCGTQGVNLLAQYWREPGGDSEVYAALASVSSRLNDRRLYEAARAVLLDPNRSETLRLDALSVMLSGYDPTLAVAFPAPTKPMYSTYVALGHTSHANQREGHVPVRGYAKKDLPEVLGGLAASDENERIRKVAGELGPLLARRDSIRAKGAR